MGVFQLAPGHTEALEGRVGAEHGRQCVTALGTGSAGSEIERVHLRRYLDRRRRRLGARAKAASAPVEVAAQVDTLNLTASRPGAQGCDALASMLRANSAFQRLGMARCELEDAHISTLALALPQARGLRILDLTHNRAMAESARALAHHLEGCRLEDLDLGFNVKLGDAGAVALADAIASGIARNLRALGLARTSLGRDGAEALARALRTDPPLARLDLSHNPNMADAGWIVLADGLRDNSHLAALRLVDTRATDKGARALAGALEGRRSLHALLVGDNAIGDSGARELLAPLSRNQGLETLSLKRCGLTANVVGQLVQTLEQNALLQELSLKDNLLPKESQDLVRVVWASSGRDRNSLEL
mmetsp:Transcript_7682/g.22659  ORF Transcript_7682/g.22659 Transcript_7682/m.22659 type:complete len:362 (-) Transcript_7682:413-1498(-)